jgi:threonyl-tRNA synthetase
MENIEKIRHSLAHLLASAIMESYPKTKLGIGPAIENGFYYDMELPKDFSPEDLAKIENRMRELIKENQEFTGKKVTKITAKKLFKNQPYKLELIKDIEDKEVGTYQNGDFLDLCKGGHVDNTKEIDPQSFKLTKLAGAYWKGNEKNNMLTRIYGVAFATKSELDAYLKMQEEAEKRDHRLLGQKLDLFTISDLVGKGLPLFTPKGAMLRELLNEYSQSLRTAKGWQKVWSPHITKNDLYKTSGHWDKFGGELFLVKSQETTDQMVMKPMNCPHHQQIFASKPRSYKDLPIKYMETTTVYRDEKAGELLGLSRVRSITQDDSHTFCTPDQIETVYQELIDVTKTFYEKIGMKIRARLSFHDPKEPKKYLGEPVLWKKAESILLDIAKKNHLDYFVAEGEAAFYGPKIDFMAKDSLGREWQLATPQLDFVQPKRFGLEYTDHEGKQQTPVMIHFALMGSLERFLSVYIEHTAGHFPLWLSPVQVAIIPVSGEKHGDYAHKVAADLRNHQIRVQVMDENESLGKRIREAETQYTPYVLIVGDKEIAANSVGVRQRGKGDLGAMALETFIETAKEEIESKKI